MDEPLVKLASANGIQTTGTHKWPDKVDEDIKRFISAPEARAIFVVEGPDGLIVGPPPRGMGVNRISIIVKPKGVISEENWDKSVIACAMPSAEGAMFSYSHASLSQTISPLFDSISSSAVNQARHKIVEAERALEQLSQHTQIAFVDSQEGVLANRAKEASEKSKKEKTDSAVIVHELNELQSIVNAWKQQVSKLAASDRDVREGSASDEVGFWIALETALRHVSEQLTSPFIKEIWSVLEANKRFHATRNFSGDTGLTESSARVQAYTQMLFRDIPLGELLASVTIDQLINSTYDVFGHINRKLRPSGYPAQRCVGFAETIGRDFKSVLLKISEGESEKTLDIEENLSDHGNNEQMDRTMTIVRQVGASNTAVQKASEAWDAVVREFATLIRDLMRKRAERFMVVKVNPSHLSLISRVMAIGSLAAKHGESLPLLSSYATSAITLDNLFHDILASTDSLTMSEADWRQLESKYSREAQKAELAIADELKQRLEVAEKSGSQDQILDVFARHQAVLVRPQVRAVTHRFQSSLLELTKQEVLNTERNLQLSPEADLVSRIMKMKQMKLRIAEIRSRLTFVIGEDWIEHVEAAHIGTACATIEKSSNPQADIKSWAEKNLSSGSIEASMKRHILEIENCEFMSTSIGGETHIVFRNLKALGFRFDISLANAIDTLVEANIAKERITDCLESIEAVAQTLRSYPRIQSCKEICKCSGRIIDFIISGLNEKCWGSEDLATYVTGFEQESSLLDTTVAQIAETDSRISELIAQSQDVTSNTDLIRFKKSALDLSRSVMSPNYTAAVSYDVKLAIANKSSFTLSHWKPPLQKVRLEMRNQMLNSEPPLTTCSENWLSELNHIVSSASMELDDVPPILIESFVSAAKKVWSSWETAISEINQWKSAQVLWELRKDHVVSQLRESSQSDDGSFDMWFLTIEELRKVQRFNSVTESRIIIDTQGAALIIESKCEDWFDTLSQTFTEDVLVRSSSLLGSSRTARRDLESSSLNMQSIILDELKFLQTAEDVRSSLEHWLPSLIKANKLINASRCALPAQWISSDLLQSESAALTSIVQKRSSDLEAEKPHILRELEARTASLVEDIKNMASYWDANKPLQAKVDPKNALKLLENLSKDFDKKNKESSNVESAFVSLSAKAPTCLQNLIVQVHEWQKESKSLSHGWSDISVSWKKIQEVGSQKYFDITTEHLSRDFSSFEGILADLPSQSKEMPAYRILKDHIEKLINESLPNLLALKSSAAIKPHHLLELVPGISRTIAEDPTSVDIWLDLPANETVKALVESAEGEYRLMQYVDTVKSKWDGLPLKGSGNVIRNLDVILPLINDHLSAFKAMIASPFFEAVSSLVQEWERKSGSARQIFDLFADVQQQYIYLKGVLTSASVAIVLPNEARRFTGLAEEFLQLSSMADTKPALEFAAAPRSNANLTRLRGQFAGLHKSLSGFLETQRQRLSRLFFVGDDELLEIVGSPLHLWEYKHSNAIFPGVSKINFDRETIVSLEGEESNIGKVDQESSDNIELLSTLDKQIKDSLRSSILRAISDSDTIWDSIPDFEKWLSSTPTQAVIVALRERWSRWIKTKHEKSDLSNLEKHYSQLLQSLPFIGDDSLLWSRRKESAIAELIYEQQNLKPDYPHSLVGILKKEEEVFVFRGSDSWSYGYEYLGVPEPIVRTIVTDDLYSSSTAAMAQSKGVSIVGPAGTGKTETIKSLGALMGRRVVVFNCDNQFDYQAVMRMMSGCVATQSWACFDEFNRLSRSVSSSVAQIVNDSLKQAPVFVTMNPGYSGRTILPPNMRDEFREFVLAAPESKEIARVILYSHGGTNPEDAEKAVESLTILDQKLSKQIQYDWGLRASKGILRIGILLKGDIQRACISAIRPMLIANDVPIFDEEHRILFSQDTKQSTGVELTDRAVKEKIQLNKQLREFVIALDIYRKLYAGTVLLGPAGCGKTTVWRELANIHDAETIIIDPSALPKSALIGTLDPITREWTDGVLSGLIRRINANLRGERSKMWFLILDGEIEPDWAEASNSLSDDNRHLSLANGEMLHLPSQLHLVFETTNLHAATPATVSRCGMICMPPYQSQSDDIIPRNVLDVARSVDHSMEFIEAQAYETAEKLALGSRWSSMAWALAGDSTEEGRLAVSNAIRHVAPKDAMLPSSGSLTDYYVSDLTGRWHSWNDSVGEPSSLDHDAISRPEILIPTVDTVCHEAILQAALTSRRPLILVGPPGSGKTMTLYSALRQMPPQIANSIPLNFSSSASPELIIQALELYCEYSIGADGAKVLAPTGSRWSVLFIDEINLPQPNNYGVVPVLQFIRHLVEHGGFHNVAGEFIKLERIQSVAACNPPPLRRSLPSSLSRHFITIHVGYPQRKALSTIYTALMRSMDPKSTISVEPMSKIYEESPKILPCETWTPRELTRWIRSINTSWSAVTEAQRTETLLWKIWSYEGQRVLCDRLSKDNRKQVDLLIGENLADKAKLKDEELWSYFISQRPKFVARDELKLFLQARVSLFMDEAASEGDRNLVIHDDFVDHISRLDRIMRQPQGHASLSGPPSVGKTTLVRFTCWLTDISLDILRTHSKYTDADFCQDLRKLLLQSSRRPVCLLLGEDLFSKPDFVELMNSLLANGEVPGLFSTAEQLAESEESSRHLGFVGGDLISWFRARVVANVHIVFVASDISAASPALLNRCVIDRVDSWSIDVRKEIAKYWCSSTDAPDAVINLLSSSFDLVDNHDGLSFIESCRQFEKAYNLRKMDLEDLQRHFVNGSDKIKSAVLEITQLKKTLDKRQDQLTKENEKSSALLSQMLHEQSEAERKRGAAVEIRAAVQQQTAKIEERRRVAHDDLAATEPLIRQAAEGVQNIKKSQLNELRALINPPEPVKITLEAVCLVLGSKTDGSWKQVLGAVRGDEFIPRIVHFDSSKMNDELISQIEQEYMSRPSFTYERVDRASKAGGPLLRWVVAQVAYGRAIAAVKPLMDEIDMLNAEAEKSRAQLRAIEEMSDDLAKAINKSKTEYSETVAQCEKLKADMHKISLKSERAKSLMDSLSDEKQRWSLAAAEFPEKLALLPQEALVDAAHIAYGGELDPAKKTELKKLIFGMFDSDMKSSVSLVSADLSSESIIDRSWSVVLIVDPSNTWDPEQIGSNVKISSFLSDSDTLGKELDTALRFGQHLVIRHAEQFDPSLLPILTRDFARKGARLSVRLGNGDVDVSPGFKSTLHTRDLGSVRQYSPLLLSKVNTVDLSISPSKFEHMVSDALLQAKVPELAERKHESMKVQLETTKRLGTLETELLCALSGSDTDKMLEDHALIDSSEKSKAESKQIQSTQMSTKETLDDLEKMAYQFESSAHHAAEIYRRISELSSVNKFYTISVDWLWDQVKKCASSSDFEHDFAIETTRCVLSVVNRNDWGIYCKSESEIQDCERFGLLDVIAGSPASKPIIAGLATANTTDPAEMIQATSTNHSGERVTCSTIPMGSIQACQKADRIISEAMDSGEWVVIQNVEVANDDWLRNLSRQSQMSQPHPEFRLILTGQQAELIEIPDLVSFGRTISIERERGVRNNVLKALTENSDQTDFSSCYIHACFAEKFASIHLGSSELNSARWIAKRSTSNIPSDDEKFFTLRRALLVSIWGAKTGSDEIKKLMKEFSDTNLTLPSQFPEDFRNWIRQLPSDIDWLPKALSI